MITAALFTWLGSSPTLGDGDSFYHAKMTQLIIQQKGPVKDFPWLPFTTLKNYYTDHHFLFHLYLIPFILIAHNPLIGIKIGTILLAAIFFMVFYWLLKKLEIKYALIFTFLPLTTSVLPLRLALAKAPASSLIILILGIFALIKQKKWLLFLISFIYVWAHGGWPTILIATLIYILAAALQECLELSPEPQKRLIGSFRFYLKSFLTSFLKKENMAIIFTCLAGLAAGLIINPYFPQNLNFYWVQTFKVAVINYQSKIGVGVEWLPYDPISLFKDNFLLTLFWLFVVCWFFLNYKKITETNKQKIWTRVQLFLVIFSTVFFLYTVKARRMAEYFLPLSTLAITAVLNQGLKTMNWREWWQKLKNFCWDNNFWVNHLLILTILVSGVTLLIEAQVHLYTNMKKFFVEQARPLDNFKGIAQFLKNNAAPRSIVFHADWSYFPMLMYYDDQNYYINGLDATFFYDQNPDLYNLWRKIVEGKVSNGLAQTIKQNFNSQFVVVDTKNQNLDKILNQNNDFNEAYQDKDGKVYKIKNF